MSEELNTTTSTVSDLEQTISEKLIINDTNGETPRILITGINGYVGSWIAYAALKSGYRVRGTVRDVNNEAKIKHLKDLSFPEVSSHKIEFIQADLLKEENWLEAVQNCDYIIHAANPYPLEDPDDEDEVVKPAVNGTNYILKAIDSLEKPPKRFIYTSNLCCCSFGIEKKDMPFGPSDFGKIEGNKPSAYFKSKILAERIVIEYFKNRNNDTTKQKIEYCCILPGMTLGPMLSTQSTVSPLVLRRILLGEIPSLADITLSCSSVFDVAIAHILACTKDNVDGNRFIVIGKRYSFKDFSDVLYKNFGKKGYKKIVSFVAPNFSIKLLAKCGNKEAKSIVSILGVKSEFDKSNTKSILGDFNVMSDETIVQTVHSAIYNGLIPDNKENEFTSSWKMPEFDTSIIPLAQKN